MEMVEGITSKGLSFNSLEDCVSVEECVSVEDCISIEAEIPEALFNGMKDFIGSNPNWDQYKVMSSALANFLFQNGCDDRAVTERYLNDLFTRSET